MSIIRSITLSQIKKTPSRFLVTVIGVIISSTMLTAVCASYSTAMEMLKQISILSSGNYHYRVQAPYTEKLERFAADERFDSFCFAQKNDEVDLGLNSSVGVTLFDGNYAEHGLITLVEGTLPKEEGEAAITERTAHAGLKIGDTLSIRLENKLITAKVTGIVKNINNALINGLYNVLVCSMPHLNDNTTLTVSFKQITKESTSYARRLAETLWQGEDVYFTPHSGLLRFYNANEADPGVYGLGDAVKAIAAVAIIIVVAASVLMIYNSFSISTAERRKIIGMLASVGATPAQKRGFAFWEALFVGGIGIPIGLLCGYIGIAVTLSLLSGTISNAFSSGASLNIHVSMQTFIFSAVLSGATVAISAFLPSATAAKVSPIEAVRGVKSIKYKAKNPSGLMRRLFGFEGALACVNMKRSGKRYAATLVSLAFAVILVITAFGPVSLIERAYSMNYGNGSYNVSAVFYGLNTENYSKIADMLMAKASSNDKVYKRFTVNGFASASHEEIFSDKALALLQDTNEKPYIRLTVIGNDEYERLAKKNAGKANGCIVQNRLVTNVDGVDTELKNHTRLKKGDYVICDFTNSVASLSVDNVINSALPNMATGFFSPEELWLLISESTFEQLVTSDMEITAEIYYNAANPEQLYSSINNDKQLSQDEYRHYSSYDDGGVSAMLLLIKVFTGGFVCLIALVAAANIANTVYTGVLLRRRELAMIKSVGLEQGRIKKMVFLESAIYSLKALMIGLPIGIAIYLLEQSIILNTMNLSFYIPYVEIITASLGVILLTVASAMPAVAALKNTPVAQLLRQDAE